MKDKRRIKPKRYAHLAGLVDGDGSFSIRFDKQSGYQITTAVYSTHCPLMKFLVHHFGGGFRKVTTIGNRKQKYCWYTSSLDIAEQLRPYLILKEKQAAIVGQFAALGSERNPEARAELAADLSRANQEYVPVERVFGLLPITPTKLDYAYLAGLFDSEGSFSIFKRTHPYGNGRYTSSARISNTDQRIFPWLLARFGGNMTVTKRETKDEGGWCMTGKKEREHKVLALLPYLTIKKRRAVLFLQWIRTNNTLNLDEKEQLFLEMKKLNHRGLPPTTNTSTSSDNGLMIESDLHGDAQSTSLVTATV